MKKIVSIIAIISAIAFYSCTKSQFADGYADPSKVSSTTVELQYAGFLSSNLNYTMYNYWQYFVVYQNTVLPWTQVTPIINNSGRFVPGVQAESDVWNTYYGFTAQYKEILKLNKSLSANDQAAKRIYLITAAIYYYDMTQKVVDLFGDIPFSEAGLLSTNGGNYQASNAKYDAAATIYTKMLDDLKGFADELNTISVPTGVNSVIKVQDFVNHGDLKKWKMYCNSLRLRLLTRVSGVAAFQSRVNSEITGILGNPTSYPLILATSENILITVTNNTSGGVNDGTNTGSGSSFYTGLIGWGSANVGGKVMIDLMNNNSDPRLRAIFEPGETASPAGSFAGLDPSLPSTSQTQADYVSKLSRYNRSTLTQNNFLPWMLINAAEVNLMLAEYYLNSGKDALAKSAYEAGITQSVNYYFWVRTLSNDNSAGPLTPLGPNEISNYLASTNISWANASTTGQKLNLIGTQKWINYNVLQPLECWAEVRRMKSPVLSFIPDNGVQQLPPNRWLYPVDEHTFNKTNYQAVAANDNFTTKIFWDVK